MEGPVQVRVYVSEDIILNLRRESVQAMLFIPRGEGEEGRKMV